MKTSLVFLLLAVSLNSFAKVTDPGSTDPGVNPGPVSTPAMPEIQMSGIGADSLGAVAKYTESYFDKRIVQRPKTEVNQYLGDLTTSFNLQLPKSFQSLQQLSFKYNSSQFLNIGYGIGFSLELPRIESEQDELRITGFGNGGVLIKTSSVAAQARIKKIASVLKLSVMPSLTYYLNQSGEDSSLYVSSQSFFAQIKTSGETWIFNKEGNPTHAFGIKNKGIQFFYNNNHLTAIKDLDAIWAVNISYAVDKKTIQNYNGVLLNKVLGINNVTILQGDRKLKYQFFYSDEYLTNVTEKGSIKKIFQADYGHVSEHKFNTIQERGDIDFKPNTALTYSADLQNLEWMDIDGESGVFSVDLNGDFYLDKVVLNIKEINSSALAHLKNYKIKCNEGTRICRAPINRSDLENLLNNLPQKLTAYIAVNDNGSLVYKEDATLSLKSGTVKFFNFSVKEEYKKIPTREDEWHVYTFQTDLKLIATPKFLDIDGNGKKDILICDNDSDFKSFDRSLSGNYNGQKQNPVVTSYYDFLTKGSDDIFKEKGSILAAFLVSSDRDVLKTFSKDLENGKFHFVLNASKLTKVNFNGSLACNQFSMPIDYNNDGHTDLLTGNKVVLFARPGAGKVLDLSKEEVKKLFNAPAADLAITKSPVELLDLKNDGKLTFVEAFASYTDRQDRSLVYLQDGMRFKVHRPAPVKLLIKENVTFGGYSQVDYIYHNGSALVSSILFSPRPAENSNSSKYSPQISKQPRYKKVYEYGGSRLSDQFNILLGHKNSKESTFLENISTNELSLSRFQSLTFDQDFQNGPLFFLSRARKNGRILKQEVFEKDGSLLNRVINTYAEKTDLGENRLYAYLKEQKNFTRGLGKVDLETINDVSSPLAPYTFLSKRETSKSSSNSINSLDKYDFNSEQFLLLLKSSQTFDGNLLKLRSDLTLSYDEAGLLVAKRQSGIESNFSYDSLGRIVGTSDQRGKNAEYSYHLTTPLVADVVEDGISRHFDYDFATNFLNKSVINNKTTFYKWSNDEILLSLDREANNQIVNFYKLEKNGLKFDIKTADTSKEYSIDGFGRIIEIRKTIADQVIIEKAVTYNDQDQEISAKIPYFADERMSVALSYTYDGLGRQTSELLSGSWNNFYVNFLKSSQYDDQGLLSQSETLSDSIVKKSHFYSNERGQVVAHETPSEAVSFSINPLGDILGVNELEAKYSYDEFGKLRSTTSLKLPWEEMFQEFSPVINKTSSTTGDMTYDAYNRVSLVKNSSTLASFEQSLAYEQGLPVRSQVNFENLGFTSENSYNDNRLLIKKSFNNVESKLDYDLFDRLTEESIKAGVNQYKVSYDFADGQLAAINPFIRSIEYNASNKPELIEFSNNVVLNLGYDLFQKIESVQIDLNGSKSAGIIYNDINNGKPTKLYNNARYYGLAQKNKTFGYSENLFLKKQPRVNSASQSVFYNQSNLERLDGFKFDYENDLLVKISHPQYGSFKNFVSPDKAWHATCPLESKSLNECFVKINNDEFQVQGAYTRAVRIEGRLVGVLYAGEFYPALTDHLGSLIALVTPKGDSLAFERVYNEWGEKESVVGNKELEKKIPWAFAGLIQHPFFNGEVLQSETRQYIPSLGQWGSADNLVKWNPNTLKNLPGNWSPLLYAGGNPVNIIDPTGHYNSDPSDGASYSMTYREQQKTDEANKWNSAEGQAYRGQAQRNLGKVALGGAAMLAGGAAGGPVMAAAGAAARTAAIVVTLEVNVAQVTIGAFVAKKPNLTNEIINSATSFISDYFFDEHGFTPGPPSNTYEYATSIKSEIEKMYYLYKE